MSGGPRRRGVVLVTVVLLLVATTLLVNASLLLARSFRRGADEAWEATRVRRAVAGRVDRAARSGDTVSTGWRPAGPDVETRIDVRRVSAELRLLAGTGRGLRARWWAGRLVWHPDPDTRGRAVQAGVRARGGVQASPSSSLARSSGACPADPGVPASGRLPAGPLRVGPLDGAALEARLPAWAPATAPATCPGGGCAPRAATAAGGRIVTGGIHAGLFVVRGDLVLAGTASVRGQLLVEGSLTIRDAAELRGSADVTGRVVLAGSGRIHADPCVVAGVWHNGVGVAVGPVMLEGRAWPLWGPPP